MIKLIKKGGLRERANRSQKYLGSENTETTLKPNCYSNAQKIAIKEFIQTEKQLSIHTENIK